MISSPRPAGRTSFWVSLSDKLLAWKRPIFLFNVALLLVLLLESLYLWGDQWSSQPKISSVITPPIDNGQQSGHDRPEHFNSAPKNAFSTAAAPIISSSTIHHAAEPSSSTTIKTSQVHYLVPASSPNEMFCTVVSSLILNRYPVPYVIGWEGQGKYNATAAHVAKLYTIQRYLESLPQGGDDDDLVIFGDGHDVMAQLPVEVMVERYFEARNDADRLLADKFGLTVQQAHDRGLRQTLFWGADKMCWPALYDEAQCSKVPTSQLPPNMFGPKSGGRDWTYHEAMFLNSGSVIGPLADLRKYINAGIEEYETTFDEDFKYKTSDQIYLSRLYGRQEVSRARQLNALAEARKNDKPGAVLNSTYQIGDKNDSEFHLTVDYESQFVQTGCYSHKWMHKLKYDRSDNTARVESDVLAQGRNFNAYPLQLPANVYRSFVRLFDSMNGNVMPATSAREWIGSLPLDTNIVTRRVFGFYHATCSKRSLVADFKKYWFHPYAEGLMKAATSTVRKDASITDGLVDGRKWVYKTSYPKTAEGDMGGVYVDAGNHEYIPYRKLCRDHLDILQRDG